MLTACPLKELAMNEEKVNVSELVAWPDPVVSSHSISRIYVDQQSFQAEKV